MLSAQEIVLQYVCPLLGMIAANFMFAGKISGAFFHVGLPKSQLIVFCKSTISGRAQCRKQGYTGTFEPDAVGDDDG
jgi:hypothetical protein